MEMKTEDPNIRHSAAVLETSPTHKVNSSRVGWGQLSSQNSHPLTVCYAGDANISAKVVKELRDRTGAGMMECKKALVEAGGDIEQAAEAMRISGQAKADKKASRVAAEGIIEAYAADGRAVLVEINSETDFVAREDSFKAFAKDVAKAAHAANAKTVEEASAAKLSTGETVEEARKAMVARIGENIVVRRALATEGANLGAYVHAGRIGVVAALEGGDEELAKDIAMHVTAANPQYVKPEDVPADVVEKEKNIQIEIAMQSGKPKDIAEKMVAGRMKKFTGEVSLTGQPFVRDPSTQVEKVLKDKNAKVTNFIRLDVGEGVETAP
jgi:elongation factor Ts